MSEREQYLSAMGGGVVESFDPELKRAFDVADNEVPASLKDPEKLHFKEGQLKLSGDGVFYTLQGEGPTMGEPATFVRTHICNLRCGWCFPAGVKIKTPQGDINIEDIKEGQEIISYKEGQYVLGQVQKLLIRKHEYLEIKTKSGVITKVTPEHIYHIDHRLSKGKRGMSREYPNRNRRCQAQFLKDKYVLRGVGTPFDYPLSLDTKSKRIGYLKGAMLGDGNITKQGKYYRLYWGVTDIEFAEAILDIVNNELNHNASITTWQPKTNKKKLVYRISISREDTAKLLMEEPSNEEEVIGFLAGFFDAEGHTGRNQLIISQQDEKVLHRVQFLLDKLGFTTSYEKRPKADAIVINGKEKLERFFKLFPVQITRKIDKFINCNRTNVTEKVISVSEIKGMTTVYNLQTTFGNMFANGYLVDQCDAYYTWNPKSEEFWTEPNDVDVKDVAQMVRDSWQPREGIQKRVVFTGGEPLIQQETIKDVIAELGDDWKVEFETNGTLMPDEELLNNPNVQFNCSPKLINSDNSRRARIKPEVVQAISQAEGGAAFKFVVMQPEELDEIETDFIDGCGIPPSQVILMPQGVTADEVRSNAQNVAEYAKEKGFRLMGRLQNEIWGARRGV